MDNAMVKRGIGAVILAIIAALLLGYLLKDKSGQRQEMIELPITTIPSLSLDEDDTQITSLIEEKTDTEDSRQSPDDDALDNMKAVTTAKVETEITLDNAVTNTASSNQNINDQNSGNNPGFSFRPPNQNEEQKFNTDQATANSEAIVVKETEETIVANTNTTKTVPSVEQKVFKPVIENEPEKKPAKTVIKNVVEKQPTKTVSTPKKATAKPKTTPLTNINEKYTIQLLATSSRSRANKLAETMTSEGYVSFITQTTSNNKILYRVRVGGYKNRDQAIKAQQGMKRRYQKNFSVQNSLVVAQ